MKLTQRKADVREEVRHSPEKCLSSWIGKRSHQLGKDLIDLATFRPHPTASGCILVMGPLGDLGKGLGLRLPLKTE